MPAPIARDVMRMIGRRDTSTSQVISVLRNAGIEDVGAALEQLLASEFVKPAHSSSRDSPRWATTINGNALAMAGFGKPIKRSTADRLVAGIIERARAINEDPSKPVYVERLRVFGSYLDETVDPLGDVDIELTTAKRATHEELEEYTRRSARNFSSYLDQLFWPEHEVALTLRNRSTALNITIHDVSTFTSSVKVIFECDPEDRTSERFPQ
jgi:predicted nucleotidyltransferase